jgi:hypothetical protein
MSELPPERDLLSRPEFRAGASAVVGGLIAGLIVLIIVLFFGGDGGDDDEQVVTTPPAPTATQAVDGATPVPPAAPTVTTTPAGPTDPIEALEAFITEELDQTYAGECPQTVPPGGVPEGYCSAQLYEAEELITFFVGPALSEAAGEAVLTRNADGSWTVTFVEAPELGTQIAVGQEAMVFGVGSCLRFHPEPKGDSAVVTCQLDGTSAQVVEGPVEEGDVTWWRLEGLGWGSGEFLAPPAP